MTDADPRDLIEALRELPEGQVIRWHDPGTADGLYLGAFLDVFADPVCHTLEWGWAWTIKDPDVQWEEWQDSTGDITAIFIPRDATHTTQDGREVAAWYPDTINRALESWVAEHVGRWDIRFQHDFDLYTPMQALAEEIEEKTKAGEYEFVHADTVLSDMGFDDESLPDRVDRSSRNEVWIERGLAEWLVGPPEPPLEEMDPDDDEDRS